MKKALSSFVFQLLFSTFLLWFVCMGCLTLREADRIRSDTEQLLGDYTAVPGYGYHWMDKASYDVDKDTDPFLYSKLMDRHHWDRESGTYREDFVFQPACILVDVDTGAVVTHSSDYLHGPLGNGEDAPYLKAVLDKDYYLLRSNGEPFSPDDIYSGLQMTGYWEDDVFVPLTMAFSQDVWTPFYEAPADDSQTLETITLYRYGIGEYDDGEPLTREGVTYPSLLDYLLAGQENFYVYSYLDENSLLDHMTIKQEYIATEDGSEYLLWVAIRSWPVRSAVFRLKWIYLSTFLLALFAVLLICESMKERLISPVREVGYRMSNGWNLPPFDLEKKRWFAEAVLLAEQYNRHQHDLYHRDKELARLNKALDYAKEAEENRRQMTSAIAHELKTPLAVIHSYAEGLKEHIAEEKRDRYLDVILSECEQMDGMVLEMLDLSRLEAGKVKLAQDTFSLAELATVIFEKLELAIQAKELRVRFDFCGDDIVTADEARMGQVITNFATNAVKYTNFGGQITVRTEKAAHKTRFIIENECPPLSSEALSKVWDTFYRTDNARSGEGTGLGLAIAKSIIELHGGSCAVQNTMTGVAFRFVI